MIANAVSASSRDALNAIRAVLGSGLQEAQSTTASAPASAAPPAAPAVAGPAPGTVRVAVDLSSLAPLVRAMTLDMAARAFTSHTADGGSRAVAGLTGDAGGNTADAPSSITETEGGSPFDNPDRGMLLPDLEAGSGSSGIDTDADRNSQQMNMLTRPEDYGHLVEAANHTNDDVSVSTITGA